MPMFKRGCVLLLLMSVSACGSNQSPSAPSSTPSPAPAPIQRPTSTFHLTGIVTDDDGRPVTGASVRILNTSVSSTTDGSGFYSLDLVTDAGHGIGWVKVNSVGHDPSYDLIPASSSQNISQNMHVYRIRRITAGESTVLTVATGDTACGDNDQFICRTAHIVAPFDGRMTIEAVPTASAVSAGLEIIIVGRGSVSHCCPLTTSVQVTAGAEVVANVGMSGASTVSQSFVLNTSLTPP
jgi:hypothetical protein